jgi:apolipoprotein D and lipocalin family protein
MPRVHAIALAFALLAGSAATAQAQQAPEPRATVNVDRFMGRWYEIARTPNDHQKNCWAASQNWTRRAANSFAIAQTCHKDSRDGRASTVNTSARILDTTTNAKWEASFFAGLIRQRYWVIDIAPDYSWMIATTADGQFPALLSRNPTMSAAQKAELIARMGRLGLPTRQLISR